MRAKKTHSPQPNELKHALLATFKTFRRPPEDPQALADQICIRVRWREMHVEAYGLDEPPAMTLERINSYVESLKTVRRNWSYLPKQFRELAQEFMAESDSTLLPHGVIAPLTACHYNDKAVLTEWRNHGIEHIQNWGPDLEIIDLLYESAMRMKDQAVNKVVRTDSSHIGLVANIASTCESHGIQISNKPRSVFSKIILTVFPDMLDPSKLIKTAQDLRNQLQE